MNYFEVNGIACDEEYGIPLAWKTLSLFIYLFFFQEEKYTSKNYSLYQLAIGQR